MFKFEANESIILEQQKAIEAALSTSPDAQKALRKIIRKYILEARKTVVDGIKFKDGDPRNSAQAVRTSVYKAVLGGNINIFNSRKAHGSGHYEPPRHPSRRGGNRMQRSARTQQIMSYAPLDRGFILRWLNEGAGPRNIEFKRNEMRHTDRWNTHPNSGNRGSIEARHFFRSLGDRALNRVRENLTEAIEDELMAIMNKKKK